MGQVCFKGKSKKSKELLYKDTTIPSSIPKTEKKPSISHILEEKPLIPRMKRNNRFASVMFEPKLLADTETMSQWYKNRDTKNVSQPRLELIMKNSSSSLKYFRDVDLSSEERDRNEKNDLKRLGGLIGSLKGVRKLHLSFKLFNKIKDEDMKQIWKMMKNLVFLKDLKVCIIGCELLTDKTVEYLTKCIKRLKGLESLAISIDGCEKLTNEAFGMINSSLVGLKNLTSLDLGGNSFYMVNYQELRFFCENLKKMNGLKMLSLDFPISKEKNADGSIQTNPFIKNSNGITSESVMINLSISLSHLKSLRTFRFDSTRSRLDWMCLPKIQGYLGGLFASLEKLACLQNISLYLGEIKYKLLPKIFGDGSFNLDYSDIITNKDLKVLAQYLSKNNMLQSVVLNLSRSERIDDHGLEILGKAFQGNVRIKEIALNFSQNNVITDQGLVSLGRYFSPLVEIQSLQLKFLEVNNLTNEGIEDLSRALENLSQMKFLLLGFFECQELSDKALESIAKLVEKMTRLEDLDLHFAVCGGFTDEAFAQLKQGLQNLSCLKRLSFSIGKNDLMTDRGLIYLCEALKSLKKLDDLSLGFFECRKITIAVLEPWAQVLKEIESAEVELDEWKWSAVNKFWSKNTEA